MNEEDPEFYRNMSNGELIHRQREANRWYAELGKKWNKTPHWDEEERESISELRQRASNYGNAIQKELDRQKEEPKSGVTSLGKAVNSWFARQEFTVPDAVNVSWRVQDRQYSGRFYHDSERLEVSIEVKPGTPGAQRRGPKYYLRCNTVEEQRAAIIAESKADPHG